MKNYQRGYIGVAIAIVAGVFLVLVILSFALKVETSAPTVSKSVQTTTQTSNQKQTQNISQNQNVSTGNCTNDHSPVCGSDNLTYQNSCYATMHGVIVKSMGSCGAATIINQPSVQYYQYSNPGYNAPTYVQQVQSRVPANSNNCSSVGGTWSSAGKCMLGYSSDLEYRCSVLGGVYEPAKGGCTPPSLPTGGYYSCPAVTMPSCTIYWIQQ